MAIKKKSGRQTTILAHVAFTFADFSRVTTVKDVQKAIEIPKGAVILGGGIVIDTVFNSTTSDVVTVGDVTTDNRYKAAINAQALGLTALVPTGYKTAVSTDIVLTLVPTGVAMPTTGAGRLWVEYYVENRSQSDQG